MIGSQVVIYMQLESRDYDHRLEQAIHWHLSSDSVACHLELLQLKW